MNEQTEFPESRPAARLMAAKRRELGGCGGGVTLELCLEALELIDRRAHVLDQFNRLLVLAAVAEALNSRELSQKLLELRLIEIAEFQAWQSTLTPSPDWAPARPVAPLPPTPGS